MSAQNVDVARTRKLWAANKPGEPSAPAHIPDPPAWWAAALALIAALVVQACAAPFIAVRGAVPPLVALVVAWYAVRAGSFRGLALGAIAGAAEDALGGTTGVAWTFATAFAGFGAGRLARSWLADVPFVLVPAAAIAVFARYGTFAIIMAAQGRPAPLPVVTLHAILWQCVLAAAIAAAALRAFPALIHDRANDR